MVDADASESPLEAAAGAAAVDATEAFALLADETRLAVLLVLWEAFEPYSDDSSVPFSELYERVDYDSPGNFSYHLEQLEGQFIRQRPNGGYEIRFTGLKLVQTIIAGAGVQDATLEPTEIDEECRLCGAQAAITYRDGVMYLVCTECGGGSTDHVMPDGYLGAMKFDPAGLEHRTAEQLDAATAVAWQRHVRTMFKGLCPTCSGAVDAWMEHCPDHDHGGCENCGREFGTRARFQCRVCEDFHAVPPKGLVLFHPAVVSFYDDHGISTWYHVDDVESVSRVMDLISEHETAITSEDPLRVAVTVSVDDDEVTLTFDETVRIVEVSR